MIHAQVDKATRQILALGYFPAGHEDVSIEIVDVDESALATVQEPGVKTLNDDGTITVTPPGPDLAAEAAAAALAQHKAATVTDMVAVFRPLAADPATAGAAAYMLKMALGVAGGMGIDVQPGDLPADLQAALAALPSGA